MNEDSIIQDTFKSHEIIPAIYSEVFKKVFSSFECREYTCKLLSEITGVNYDYLLDNLMITCDDKNLSKSNATLKIGNLSLVLNVKNSHKSRLIFQNNIYKRDYISKQINAGNGNSIEDDIYIIKFDLHNLYKKSFSEFKFIEKDTGEFEDCSYQKYHINVFKILNKYHHKKELSFKEKLIVILGLDNKYELIDVCKTDRILNTVLDVLKTIKTKELIKKLSSNEYQHEITEIEKEYEQLESNRIGRISVARNMLADKLDFKVISKYTDINVEELRKINEIRTD